MTHTMPTQHDAEEAMRPYLGEIHEVVISADGSIESVAEERDALQAALDKALDLLGVQR